MSTSQLAPPNRRGKGASRGRFAYGLTSRALVLFLLGLVWLVPAFFLRQFAWALVAWDALVLSLAVADGLRLPAPSAIEAERIWSSAPAISNSTEVLLSIRQPGPGTLFFTALDDLPPAFLDEPPPVFLKAFPGVAATARYSFIPRSRGDAQAGQLFLRYRSAAGLAERWAVADLSQTVRIYPALRSPEAHSLFLMRLRQIEMQLRKRRQRGLGREFESLRDYREGDDLRDICWTATARRGAPVSKQYEIEKNQPVWIVLDSGRLLQERVAGYTKLDYAASASVALAQLALQSGDRAGLLAYGREIQQRILPGRGGPQLRRFVDALALVRGEAAEADHLRATVAFDRMQPRRSLVLWLTDLSEAALRPEVIEGAAQLMRRHLVLFVTIRQADLGRLAHARPRDAGEMFATAAATELLARREALLAQLRERGGLTLETEPQGLATQLLNRYLEVKERALV
ncbi:MAG TPA: DUF58 domain-containing protein [Acidobacteriaceae bacterium]|nr:DUF58 domain-containing protein [Acidobacteriaceae bacterium]